MTNASPIASTLLDRVLVLEMVRVTEAAAVAASRLIGRGDEKAADPTNMRRLPPPLILQRLAKRRATGRRSR